MTRNADVPLLPGEGSARNVARGDAECAFPVSLANHGPYMETRNRKTAHDAAIFDVRLRRGPALVEFTILPRLPNGQTQPGRRPDSNAGQAGKNEDVADP